MGEPKIVSDSARNTATRLGFWSAIWMAVLAAASFAVAIFGTPYNALPYPYVAPFIAVDYAWMYPAFLSAPTFILLMTCLHHYAPDEKKIFSQSSLSFALVYAVVITIDYFIQWTVVLPSTLRGETAGLSLFTMYNPHGLFVALEGLGYLMMDAAFLFAAAVFAGGRGRLERSIRWLFVSSFVLAVGSFTLLSLLGYDIVVFEVTILTINWIVLIVSGALLSVTFRRANLLIIGSSQPGHGVS